MTGKPLLRFAFDLGTNSIGWAVYCLDQPATQSPVSSGLLSCGVRLFDDGRNPKDGRSLAEMRRVPRASRRRRDRFVLRRTELFSLLADVGLMPVDAREQQALKSKDPYELRARGLDHALYPHEIGRALFHLNQRRGFKSNRRADRKTKEKGKIKEASDRLVERLAEANARTFGEYLWRRHGGPDGKATPRTRKPVRIRLEGDGANALYEFYPTREILLKEFDEILVAQQRYHPAILTPDVVARLRATLFRQRDLKPVAVGRCTLEPGEQRLPKALPSVEARVIYETLNHLKFGQGLSLKNTLTKEQRDLLAAPLLQGYAGTKISFDKILAALKLPSDTRFSLEDAGKKDLKDYSSKSAAGLGHKDRFGANWHNLSLETRDLIVSTLLDEDDEQKLKAWLKSQHGLTDAAADAVITWVAPEGYSRLGATANEAILSELKDDHACTYSNAVASAGKKLERPWHHSDFRDGVIEIPLPYYGKVLERHVIPPTDVAAGERNPELIHGRLPNPTVHIALGQLRRLINKLMKAEGEPAQIVIELARDLKLNQKQKDEEQRKNADNRRANDLRRQELDKQGVQDTGENRQRLRLFEEQQRANGGVALCPYSLKPIGIEKLFSSEVDIDHILPYSRTLDDTSANRIICYRDTNRLKRNKSPFEALGQNTDWAKIVVNAQGLAKNKSWRFGPEAMERFEKTERNFLARQINETRHLSRLARFYLGAVCGPDNVYVTTGQLTSMLRARWGLNSVLKSHNQEKIEGIKNRNDHRHHAIDACVIGAIDRSLLQELSRLAGQAELEDRNHVTKDVPEPFSGFRDTVRDKVNAITVSMKPEHGISGALHEDTAYGLVKNPVEAAEIGNLVFRKPLTALTASEIDRVRDPNLRKAIQNVTGSVRDNKKALEIKLAEFASQKTKGREQGIRRVRIGKAKTGEVHIKDRQTGAVYKALIPGENHHIDIVQLRDGSWQGFAATVFEVNQKDWRPVWERDKLGGKLVMRVHKGDTIEVDDADGQRRFKTVHRLSISNNILYLAPHNEGGELGKRHDDKDDLFRWDFANIGGLKKRNARKVRIDETGAKTVLRSNV